MSPIAAGAALIVFAVLGFTPIFNLGLILLFPYACLGLALGLPQTRCTAKMFSLSYEMYLVGWPTQQVVRMPCGEMSPILNWLIATPFAILLGWIVYCIAKAFPLGSGTSGDVHS